MPAGVAEALVYRLRAARTNNCRSTARGSASGRRDGCGAQFPALKRRQVSSPWSIPWASVAAGYLPILLFLIVALGLSAGFVVLPMIVSRFTGAHRPNPAKLSEYECGFPAFEDARAEFDVRFYLVAILFIVFDLEAAFLFPWAVSLSFTKWTGWAAMIVFLIELGPGPAHARKKGAPEWEGVPAVPKTGCRPRRGWRAAPASFRAKSIRPSCLSF